jgi:hypothetical protein
LAAAGTDVLFTCHSDAVRSPFLFHIHDASGNQPSQGFVAPVTKIILGCPAINAVYRLRVTKVDGRLTLAEAAKEGSLGYQAELTLGLAFIAVQRKQTAQALESISRAAEFARAAGGNRILAGIALERARILRGAN